MTPDYEYFQQVLPPELARQIMLGKDKMIFDFDMEGQLLWS